MSKRNWLAGVGLGVLGIALGAGTCVGGHGPIRLKWPKSIDPAAVEVVGGYSRLDSRSNLEILGEVENRGSTELGIVFVGVTLLDSAGNPVEAGSDPDSTFLLRRLEDMGRVRFGWERHVNLGRGARKRVPPGERTPFKIVIEKDRAMPFASLRFFAGAIEAKPAPVVSVQALTQEPGPRARVIRGQIVNVGSIPCNDPTVVVALHDSSGKLLRHFTAVPDVDVLPAGGSDVFETLDNSASVDPRVDAWANCR